MKGTPKSREGQNLLRNWGSGLPNFFKHVCDPKTAKGKDDGKKKPVFTNSNWNFGSAGGVASWGGTGGTSSAYHPKNLGKGHTAKFIPMTPADITIVSGVASLLAGIFGGPVAAGAAYGGVNSFLNSANAGDPGKVVVGKTLAGGALGALGGGVTGLLGKSKPIISFLAGTGVDTGIDQGMVALHGEPITLKTIGASLLINGVFNGLGTSALPKSVSKRVSYSDVFEGELVNFNPGYTVRNTIDKDIILVQYTSSLGGSMKYWTTANYANNFSTLDDYMDSLAISNTRRH